jgi:hypothetical protein
MRILIGFYFVAGLVQVAMAGVMVYFGVSSRLAPRPDGPRRSDYLEEALLLAAIELVLAFLTLLAAYGLWKRWRIVRLVLIGMSLWTLALCTFIACVALAMIAGVTDGRAFGVHDTPADTLWQAGAISAFALLHWWLLVRRPMREAYQRSGNPALSPGRDVTSFNP